MGWAARQKRKIDRRPTAGGLVVPFMVDDTLDPIDFKAVDDKHVARCATYRLCGICGGRIMPGPLVFIGPDDGRSCFADPWMHVNCAKVAMTQCPFLNSRTGWRESNSPLTKIYEHNMKPFIGKDGQAHQDAFGAWHFQAIGPLRRLEPNE